MLGGAPPGLPPDRGMELVIEMGDAPMPRSCPVKRLSEGELAELCTQLVDLLDRGWILDRRALDRRARGVSGVRAEAGRDVADLLRLPGPQRHQPARGGAAPAH